MAQVVSLSPGSVPSQIFQGGPPSSGGSSLLAQGSSFCPRLVPCQIPQEGPVFPKDWSILRLLRRVLLPQEDPPCLPRGALFAQGRSLVGFLRRVLLAQEGPPCPRGSLCPGYGPPSSGGSSLSMGVLFSQSLSLLLRRVLLQRALFAQGPPSSRGLSLLVCHSLCTMCIKLQLSELFKCFGHFLPAPFEMPPAQ